MTIDEGTVKLLNEAYLRMTDVGPGHSLGEEYETQTYAYLSYALERLAELDDKSVYETIGALDEGALRAMAAQAVVELRHLGYRMPIAEAEDDE